MSINKYCIDCERWVDVNVEEDYDPPDCYDFTESCSLCGSYNLLKESEYELMLENVEYDEN